MNCELYFVFLHVRSLMKYTNMELLLKNVQEKHLNLIAELARSLNINIEGPKKANETKLSAKEEEHESLEEGLFLSWLDKKQ